MTEVKNQVFQDISKTGKDRKWRERKLKNIELAGQLDILGYRSFERVYQCAEVLKFVEQSDGTKNYISLISAKISCVLCATGEGR